MNTQTMPPSITVSRRDFDRLEALLESPRWQNHASAAALMQELERAQVLEPDQIGPDVVTMNSTVTCIDETDGSERTLTLCYPNESDSAQGRISVLAPVGAALLGLSIGQSIDWPGPEGRPLRLRVAAVSYQPEAAGDYHL
ncbi:MAG: nucleoside diphosphate kinase regulator [Lysobacteraceae bacterium]